MRNRVMKFTSITLCTILLCIPSADTLAAGQEMQTSEGNKNIAANADDSEITDHSEASKEETVYVLADADGTIRKIIVSDWMKNTIGADTLTDFSELSNIENIKGNESCTVGSDGSLIWDAQGNDIYYQGESEKELPVSLSVTYKLDGSPISPDELAGKSGKVTIRFDYTNTQYELAEINGKEEKIYVPFVMLTGILLDNDIFTNINVSNGKIMNDGDHTAVVGLALPGMQESLGINSDQFELPDYMEITADAKDFELGMTVTLASNEMFQNIETEKLNFLNDLGGSTEELIDAIEQLADGSSTLYEGLCTLLEKSDELVLGIDQLADGAKNLSDGISVLDNGTAQLQSGTEQLCSGLNTLQANNDNLNLGAQQVFESLLSTATAQLTAAGLTIPAMSISNYADVLNGLIAALDETGVYNQVLEQVTAAAEAQRSSIESQVAAAINTEKMQSEEANAFIAQNTELQIQKAISESMISEEIQSKLTSASENAQSIIALKASLDRYHVFYLGLQSYTAGVTNAALGAGELKSGIDTLKSGAGELVTGSSALYDGITTLQTSTPELVTGITQLCDGSLELSNGLTAFNEEGIQKLTDAVDGDLEGLTKRILAVTDSGKTYQSYSGLSENMDGSIRFVYKTDGIKKQ